MRYSTKYSTLLLSGLLAVFVASANANASERWPRWYVGLSAGLGFLEESDVTGTISGDLDYDTGAAFSASLGYMPFFNQAYLDNLRLEAELGVHYNGLDGYTNGGVPGATNDSLRMVSYMGNLLYDFRNESQWTPYVGAGAGMAHVRLPRTSGLSNTEDGDNVFAYQLLGGLTYAPETIPMTEWGFGYRYFNAESPSFSSTGGHVKLDDVMAHSVEASARFRF